MSKIQVALLGALILISFILTAIATFSNYWITWHAGPVHLHSGLVPWNSHEPGWLNAASWCMFCTFGLYFPLFALFLFSAFKVYHHGCSHGVRAHFFGVLIMCLMIACFQIAAFTLVAINAVNYTFWRTNIANKSIGSSAFLAVISGVLMALATVLSGNVAQRHCR